MGSRISDLVQTLRALDDIRHEIEKIRRYINFEPDNVFETDAQEAYNNSLSRLLTIRNALEKRKKELEN